MDFHYLGLVNRLLQQAKQTPITAITTTVNTMAYRAQLAVNDALKDIAMLLKIKTRLVEFTFSTVAGQRNYCIPKRIAYPFTSLKASSIINPMPASDYDIFSSSILGVDNPYIYFLVGYQGVARQPLVTGEALSFVSSSASDTSTMVIQGWDTNNNYITEEIVLAGAGTVTSVNTYKFVDSISKLVTIGTITVTSASSIAILSLTPKETHVRYPVIGLGSVPADSITIYGRGYLTMPNLVNEYDMPLGLDDRALNAIISGAMYQFMRYDPVIKPEGLDFYKQNYYDEIKKIKADNSDDGVQYYMKSPYFGMRQIGGYQDPLNQGILG
jgi:hypothetical protein